MPEKNLAVLSNNSRVIVLYWPISRPNDKVITGKVISVYFFHLDKTMSLEDNVLKACICNHAMHDRKFAVAEENYK
jgi:hypothetical protein